MSDEGAIKKEGGKLAKKKKKLGKKAAADKNQYIRQLEAEQWKALQQHHENEIREYEENIKHHQQRIERTSGKIEKIERTIERLIDLLIVFMLDIDVSLNFLIKIKLLNKSVSSLWLYSNYFS